MATHEIHSYHINVFNGDAAIHLLVEPGQTAAGKDDTSKGKVKRAILVDGGKPAAADQIKKAIKFIGTAYDVTAQDNAAGATSLKFDGIVVTRWALDHSAGILSLIIQQLNTDHPSSGTPSTVKGCSLMKYDGDSPATYFYSPYWTGVAASKLKKNKDLAPTANIKINDGKPFVFDNEKRAVDFSQGSKTPWKTVCYLLASPRELIGREFFTGKAADAPTGTDPHWYADIKGMADGAKGPYGDTGIFCIGADGVVPATTPEHSFTSITLVSPQKGTPSIALVAVIGGTVQHYFSGDSDYQVDDAAASWLSGTVPVAKLSSHGSLVSWPHKALDAKGLLNTLQPQHFICSTGPSSVEGLHPRWELLLLLHALVRKWLLTGDNPKDVTPFFHSTNYPVWFVAKDPKSTAPSFNFDAFTKAFAEDPTDKNALALLNMFNDADSNLTEYLRSILTDAKTNAIDKTRFVIDYIRNLWVSMSYSSSEQHPVAGATTDSGALVNPQTQLLAIVAKLSASAPIISYINGALKTVADSESPPVRSTDLDPGNGGAWPVPKSYTAPKGTTARGESLAAASTAKYDVAPQGVKLPENTPAVTESKWQDTDDEVPSEDYAKLVQNLDKTDKIPDGSAISIFGGTNTPTTWLVAKTAYPNLKLASGETEIVLLGDDDSSFVGNLVPGFIGIGAAGTDLDPNADYWAWLMSAGMIKTTIALTMDTVGTTIEGVAMTCNLFDNSPLTFDTKSAAAQFGTNTWPPDQNGCTINDTGVILVGLDGENASNAITVKLDQVVDKFRMQSTSTSPKTKLKTLLKAIGSKTLDISLVAKADTASQGCRNAIWCSASGGLYSFTLRLTWKAKLTAIFDKIAEYLKSYLGLDVSSAIVVVNDQLNNLTIEAQLTGRYQPTIAGGYHIVTESSFTFSTQITVKNNELDISIAYGNTGDMEIYVKPNGGFGILNLVETLCNLNDQSISNSKTNIPSDLSDKLNLAYIWLARDDSRTTFGIGFVLNFGSTPVGLTYSSAGVYQGALITTSPLTSSEKLLPSYDAGKDASSLVDATSTGVLITSLFNSGISSMPNGLPTTITQASITYDHDGPNPTISLVATLTRDSTVTNSVPAFEIDKVTLNATKSTNATTFELLTDIKINPDADSTLSPATLSATISYKESQWLFKGHLESFQLGILFSHFPTGWQNAATDVLGQIDVTTLDVMYTYSAKGAASSFLITGTILFGELELRLYYQYTSADVKDQKESAAAQIQSEGSDESKKDAAALKGKQVITQEEFVKAGKKTAWTFYAYLGASADAQSATIGSVIDSFDNGLSDYLPGFVSSTPVTPADPASGDVPIMVYMEEIPDKGLLFVAHVHLGDVTLTLVQFSDKVDDKPTETSAKLPPVKSGSIQPKRILRIGISKLPLIDKIPLVNQLPQPFDDLEYMWVTYPAPTDKPDAPEDRTLGFSAAEIGTINDRLTAQNIPEILIKESTRKDPSSTSQTPPPDTGETDVALAAGQHFVVIHGGKAVVDYNFSSQKKKKETVVPKPLVHQQQKQIVRRDKANDSPNTDEPVKKGAIDSKPTKILTVQNVGLKYTDGVLWIQLDATVTLGPISFSVIGFGVGFDVASLQGNGGLHFSTDSASDVIKKLLASVRLELSGAALSFIQPPLTLAGVFVHNNSNGDDSYAGGIAVGIPPYLLMAVGEYHEITGPPSYKSVFIFAKLDGPLISLELATIEGIRLGFGYNSFVQPPNLNDLTSFPFIADTPPGLTDPMQVLQAMQQVVSPQQGTFWGAIGMKITALSLISASAVAVIEYSPKGLDVQIYVDAVLQMPADPAGQGAKAGLLYVEITMIIELNFIEGFFRVDAALAPTSYIYVPPCHLTGGFAMCYWFNPSNYAGDFVFSIGGYHAQFTPPTYYPNPKRVGISFQLSDAVSVTGEAYFAITPKVVMGGGRLHIQFDIPLISAYFDAFADFLIMYKPFHYTADIGVDVGVSFDFDCWIIHIHISAHIGANLHIEGPEFGGSAHVDLWVHAFDIPFGSAPRAPVPLLLNTPVDGPAGFYDLLQTPGPANPSTQDQSDSDPTMNNLKISLEAGEFSDANKQDKSIKTVAGTYWRVRGGTFVFRVTCVFAISNYTVNDDKDQDVRVPAKKGDPVAEDDVYANPMYISDKISSVLTVKITPEDDPDGKTDPLDLYKPLPVIKAVPKALWRSHATNTTADLLDGNNSVVKLAMGLSISAPDPQLSYNTIPAFHAADAMSQNVYPETAVPDPTPTDPTNTKEAVVNPALPDSAPVQTSSRPAPVDGKTEQEKWDNVQHAWRSALALPWPVPNASASSKPTPVPTLQSILDQCAGVLGWGAGHALMGLAPTKLLGTGFDAFYLALPEVTGVA